MAGVGAFGKMPSLGDFFRLDLSHAFVEPWDQWLQQGVQSARTELGAQWNECFMSAPIWRFTIKAGLVGPHAMLGVLMPSVDRVGRQFPLTLAIQLRNVADIAFAHFTSGLLFEQLEAVALGALEDGFTRDMLSHRLVQISASNDVAVGEIAASETQVVCTGVNPVASLAAAAVQGKPNAAIWSAELENERPMMMTSQLPTPYQMRGLFDLDAPVWARANTSEVVG